MVENWAESATAVAPHTMPNAITSAGGAPNRKPAASEHAPDSAMASAAVRVRPQRSASPPAAHEPASPEAIARNAPSGAHGTAPMPARARLSARNTANQPHIAYSSHM